MTETKNKIASILRSYCDGNKILVADGTLDAFAKHLTYAGLHFNSTDCIAKVIYDAQERDIAKLHDKISEQANTIKYYQKLYADEIEHRVRFAEEVERLIEELQNCKKLLEEAVNG